MRSLEAYIGRRHIGTLYEGEDIWRFEYDPVWSEAPDAFDLAPGLPRAQRVHLDGSSTRRVQWYFDNLLPEELLRLAISKEAGIKGEDAFALLQYLGAESAGSLTLLAPGEALPDTASLRILTPEELSARIAGLPRQTLTAQAPKRMSLAGAQHKLLVVYRDGTIYEPQQATPSSHILKPAHPDTASYPASVFNEYLTMRLADAAGLDVPAVHIRYVPDPIYLIDRFDRRVTVTGTTGEGLPEVQIERLHIIDACQLLDRARTFKHSGASLEALRHVIESTTNKLHSRIEIFRWLVFNLVMANDDCHLKNLSFFMASDGIKLAPHYDMLATGAYYTPTFADERATWAKVPMAIALPGAQLFSEVTRDNVLAAAHELGVPSTAARRILAEVMTRLPVALKEEERELAKRHAALPAEARVFQAAETRLINVLTHIILPEMLGQLSK